MFSKLTTRANGIEFSLRSYVAASLRLGGKLGQGGDRPPVAVRARQPEDFLEPRRRETRALDSRRVLQIDVGAGQDRLVRRMVDRVEALDALDVGLVREKDHVRMRRFGAEGMT